ncbi:MAG TPA: hypothetical protein VFH61_14660 [Thermoleophilia bacterium]|nr:hypothetical protein [Thermoleophilia bacterium]
MRHLLPTLLLLLLLAAGSPAYGQTAEAAEQGLSILEKIQAGGVPLICLTVAALACYIAYMQMNANKKLHEDHFKTQGDLLREMLARDKEGMEAHIASTRAIQDVTTALREAKVSCDETNRRVSSQTTTIDDLKDEIRRLANEGRG